MGETSAGSIIGEINRGRKGIIVDLGNIAVGVIAVGHAVVGRVGNGFDLPVGTK